MRLSSALVVAALSGCAPAAVVTVQPGAVDKDVLEGEWYWRDTVAEVPYGTNVTFTGAQTDLERIRWKIEEDLLLGYRSYENVDESDAASGVDVADGEYFGAPLLAFAIEKHFDIRRSYDRTTGEEGNVVEENTERPWYEREYVRVDWSTNLAEAGWTFAGVQLEVLEWSTDAPTAGAPQLDDSDGDGVVDSILLTTQVLAQPSTTYLPGWGDVPVCLFYGEAEYECGASEVSIRSSFVKVDRSPYQGMAYDDTFMETFGFFTTERLAYDRAYGLVEPNRVFWANRHDLWKQSYATDPLGNVWCEDADGDTGPCAELSKDDDPAPIVIPYAEREVAPIVYHAGPGFPSDLLPVMEQIAADWNAPMADIVHELRFWECTDGGGKAADCEDVRDAEIAAFVFCPNNPSLPTDPDVCSTDHTGPGGHPDGIPDAILPGDLRYHLVHIVDNPQISSPFGYGPSAADPVGTDVALADGELQLGAGEIVSANAFVYGHVLDRVSYQVADLVQLINGELDPDSFVAGENVEAWVEAVRSGSVREFTGRTDGMPERLDRAEVERELDRISNGFGELLHAELGDVGLPTSPGEFRAWYEHVGQTLQTSAAVGAGPSEDLVQLETLMESPYDDLLWDAETIGAYGWDPALVAAPPADSSPLDLVHPTTLSEREAGLVLAGQHAVDLDSSFTDGPLLGLARHYAASGLTYEQIVQDVRENLFREVMLHEVGHTLGLRHNFAGSFDAFNFHPTYWELRDDGAMGPRHVDPETEAEIDGRIREYQYASIMDYPGSRAGGWHGLGKYDVAAVKFGYGSLVEVLTAVPEEPAIEGLPNVDGIGYLSFFSAFTAYPTPVLQYTSGAILEMHYTDYPAMAGDLEARVDVPLAKLSPTFEDEPGFSAMLTTTKVKGVVEAGLPVVPYRFCSDELAVGTTCARFDEGADPYEVQTFLMEQYWNQYILNNFARDRYGFGSSGAYLSSTYGRIFEPLRTWERYYALFHGIYGVHDDPLAADYFASDRGFGGWTAATDESFRFLTRIVMRPEPGPHATTQRPDGTEHLAPAFEGTVEIPLVAGAWYESEWDFDSGYHWFERQQRIGTYWDRMLALYVLTTTSSDGFLGYDTAIDPRAYSIGYQDLYGDALGLFLGELMSDEADQLGPVLDGEDLVYRDVLELGASWPPAYGELVSPGAYWLVQYDAGLFGKALLADGYDRTFLNRGRIYVDGSEDAITVPEGQPTVSFVDPYSGQTYVAWSFPATDGEVQQVDALGKPIELGSGARMLLKAQSLATRCETDDLACAELERFVSDLDLQTQIYAYFD